MNKYSTLAIIFILALVIFGCDQSPLAPDSESGSDDRSIHTISTIIDEFGPYDPVEYGLFNEDGYQSQDFILWAGQNIQAGTVTVSNDSSGITVLYDTDESADLNAVHVYVYTDVADIPTDNRPTPGRAPYKADNMSVDSYEVFIPFSDLGGLANCGSEFYIVAHAALSADNPDDDQEDADSNLENSGETAYAGGDAEGLPAVGGGGGSWYYAARYSVICGDPQNEDPEDPEENTYLLDGTVYYDLNENGVQDAGEPGIEGVEVTLILEDESTVQILTDSEGYYSFADLEEGDYTVEVGEHNQREHTTASSSEFTLSEDTTIDFGYAGYFINGTIFYDLDEDGIQGPGEPGIEGVEISLNGNTIYSDEFGNYLFEQLAPGEYTIVADEYNNRVHTTPATIETAIVDSDLTLDFGYEGYHINGILFYDVNGNGVQDVDEPGLEGVEISLSNGETLITDENGYYDFSGLLPGDCTIDTITPGGFNATLPVSVETSISDDDFLVNFGFEVDFEGLCGATADGFTIGFWKNNISKALQGKNRGIQIDAATLESYLDEISGFALYPLNFASLNDAYDTLNAKGSGEILLLSKQLTGSEFNFMNQAYINDNELLTWAFLYWGEYIVAHADQFSRSEILEAKDWFDAYNNSHGGQFFGPDCQ